MPASGNGHHNAGADCAACHNNLGPNLQWTVAGTLFSAISGGAPVSGATIEVVDASGTVTRLATATNGNFFTTQPFVFPVHVRASQCPADASMVGAVQQGSCNGCHNSSFQIHLP